MFYFIPAWYNEYRKWYDSNDIWYRNYNKKGFDDTVNQVKIFSEQGEDICLLILNYSPNLRYFLHNQDLLETKYWSLFDYLQDIKNNNFKVVDYKKFLLDKDFELTYTPFNILLRKDKKTFGTIEFSEDGNVFYVEEKLYENKRLVFDDRGFVSSVVYFDKQGNEFYQEYLNDIGEVQFREYLGENKFVEISDNARNRFLKKTYNDIDELVKEKLKEYCQKVMVKSDTAIIAAKQQNNEILKFLPNYTKKILSFFGDREIVYSNEQEVQSLVVDTEKKKIALLDKVDDEHKIHTITPYDTRLRLGSSQSLKELNIFVATRDVDLELIKTLIKKIILLMDKNKNIRLILQIEDQQQKMLEQYIQEIFEENYLSDLILDEEEYEFVLNKYLEKVELVVINSEIDLIKKLNLMRIVIDLADEPDVFLQIASISAGIPQINIKENAYVVNNKNGIVIKDIDELEKALEFYLSGLRNWNESLIYSIQQIEKFTGEKIVTYWKEKIIGEYDG